MAELTNQNFKHGITLLIVIIIFTYIILNSGVLTGDMNDAYYKAIAPQHKKITMNTREQYNNSETRINKYINEKQKYETVTLSELCNGFSIPQPGINYCSNIIRPNENDIDRRKRLWQTQTLYFPRNVTRQIFTAYSYYDDRPILEGSVMIRMFAVVTGARGLVWLSNVYCYLWVECMKHPLKVQATVTGINGRRKLIVNNITYNNVIFSCPLPDEIVKNRKTNVTHISLINLSNREICPEPQLYVPVIYPVKPKTWTHTVGMCEANGVSFGYFDDKMAPWLIEWFEANLMFGVTEFNIYNSTLQISANVKKVLEYYIGKGWLIFHQHPTPLDQYDPSDRDAADIGMRTSLNDCFYRNMYRYKYILGIDLDELVVPRKHDNYTEMLKAIEPYKKENYTRSYIAMAGAFFQSFLGKDDQKVESDYPLRTAQYVYRVYDNRMKSFSNPRVCLGMFSHYCLSKLPGAPGVKKYLSTGTAAVHHYRNTCLKGHSHGYEYCERQEARKRKSERMIYFQDKLLERVTSVANQLQIKLNLQ